jgi:hypothetical protein
MIDSIMNKMRQYSDAIISTMELIEKVLKWIAIAFLITAPIYIWFKIGSIFYIVLFMILLSPIIITMYIKKLNVLTASIFVLFALPISLSSYLMVFLNLAIPNLFTNLVFVYYYMFSIPIMSLLVVVYYIRKKNYHDMIKVSLEYNSWIYALILFGLFFASYSTNNSTNLSMLIPTVNPETLTNSSPDDLRDLISLFFQIASTPFILANGILKSLIEHLNYRKSLTDNHQEPPQEEPDEVE